MFSLSSLKRSAFPVELFAGIIVPMAAFIGVLMIVIPMAASGVTGIIPIIIPGSVRDA